MFKVRKNITANTKALSSTPKFSTRDVYYFLSHIDELKKKKISVSENEDGSCEFTIDNSIYQLVFSENDPTNFAPVFDDVVPTI